MKTLVEIANAAIDYPMGNQLRVLVYAKDGEGLFAATKALAGSKHDFEVSYHTDCKHESHITYMISVTRPNLDGASSLAVRRLGALRDEVAEILEGF